MNIETKKRTAYSSAYGHTMGGSLRIEVGSVLTPDQIRKLHTSMNNRRTALIVISLRDPVILEGWQASKDGSSNPGTVFSLGYGEDPHSHTVRREFNELFAHAVGDAGAHGCSTRKDDGAVSKEKWVRVSQGERKAHSSRLREKS